MLGDKKIILLSDEPDTLILMYKKVLVIRFTGKSSSEDTQKVITRKYLSEVLDIDLTNLDLIKKYSNETIICANAKEALRIIETTTIWSKLNL